jgi:hypothetical protein
MLDILQLGFASRLNAYRDYCTLAGATSDIYRTAASGIVHHDQQRSLSSFACG